ncbi:MAG: hypothetical protein K0Q55_1689 [Verrucomicrobia bacterium]|jgi:hypothetical protein|nr:hypothetical protein [Verrucomicrobiota bacterium]
MEETATPQPPKSSGVMAGQPITFGGVAGFGRSSWRRLFIAQSIVAGGAVAAVLILLFSAWLPSIDHAIHQLPDNGYILRGELAWPNLEAVQLSESRWLGIIAVPANSHTFGRSSDVQLELHSKEARIYSMFGYVPLPYEPSFSLVLSRPDAVPWWGARRPFFIAGAIATTFIGLWLQWMVLALVYAPIAKFIAFWGDRDLKWSESIRLSAAALLTPAVVYSIAIALYGLGWLPLEGLLAACGLHVVMGWAYVAGATFSLPRRTELAVIPKTNPFNHPTEAKPVEKPAANPFKDA